MVTFGQFAKLCKSWKLHCHRSSHSCPSPIMTDRHRAATVSPSQAAKCRAVLQVQPLPPKCWKFFASAYKFIQSAMDEMLGKAIWHDLAAIKCKKTLGGRGSARTPVEEFTALPTPQLRRWLAAISPITLPPLSAFQASGYLAFMSHLSPPSKFQTHLKS